MKTHLVLSGGGLNGAAMLGALSRMDLANIRAISGCSVGAIIGFMLSCGYNVNDILSIVRDTCFFSHNGWDIDNLVTRFGLDDQSMIRSMLRMRCEEKTGLDNPSILDLYKCTGIHLIVNAVNITTRRCEYLDHKTNPDMKAIDAVLHSSRIPLYFCANEKGDKYVDGSMCDNFPSAPFRSVPRDNIIGVEIVSQPSIDNLLGYIQNIFMACQSQSERNFYVVQISCDRFPISLDYTSKDVNDLYDLGKNTIDLKKGKC